jgi:hypothetical protein
MADPSRNVPSAMTDFFGHIPPHVTDRSTSFFNLYAAWKKPPARASTKTILTAGLKILSRLLCNLSPVA